MANKKMANKIIIGSIVLVAVLAGVYVLFLQGGKKETTPIATFEECAAAGYAIMESYPRQCRSASGELFVEQIEEGAL